MKCWFLKILPFVLFSIKRIKIFIITYFYLQVQANQQPVVQQQLIPAQQYAVLQENSLNNGTRQIYFVGSNNTSNDIVIDEGQQNQQQPIVLNHQLAQNNTLRARTPVQQLTVRGTNSGATGGVRQPLSQVDCTFIEDEIYLLYISWYIC